MVRLKLTEEQKKLVEENRNLVYFTINRFFQNSFAIVEKDELIGEGMLALCKCIPYYDSGKGCISTFITKCIKKHLSYYIMRKMKRKLDVVNIDDVSKKLSYYDDYDFDMNKNLEEYLHKILKEPFASMAVDFYIYNKSWKEIAIRYNFKNRETACALLNSKLKNIPEDRNKFIELFL